MDINPIHINTIGLIFDIIGAWFVAWEVVRKFDGQKYEQSPYITDADKPPYDSKEYKKWESSKYKRMRLGLIFLTIGFLLQISSNYIKDETNYSHRPENSKNRSIQPIVSETTPTTKPPQNKAVEPIISPPIKAAEPIEKKAINTK